MAQRNLFPASQRNLFPASQMPTVDGEPICNHPPLDHPLHLGAGNGSLMLAMDGAASAAVSRPSDHPSSSYSTYMPTNSGPLYDPNFHPQSASSSYWCPADQVLCMRPPSFHQYRDSIVNPETELERAAYKRKSPAMPSFFSGGSGDCYYGAGSSSNLQISLNPLQMKPLARPQYWPSDPASIIHDYRGENLLAAGEDSQRNVRSRHNHTFHTETNPAVVLSSSSNVAPHFYATGNSSGLNMDAHSRHVPMPMVSEDPYINYDGSQSFAGPSVMNNAIGTNVAFHPNIMRSWHTNSSPTYYHPLTHDTGAGSIGHNQRLNPHRSSPNYTFTRSATASLEGDGGASRLEPLLPASSRYSRPLSITGRSSYRNERTRSSYGRFQASYNERTARSRWSSEGAATMEQTTYYDSRNWFDQHGDMRLDIDNMSYEELLALEERIGDVTIGLSEEKISSCLQKIISHSSNQSDDSEEWKCAICLEEYADQDELGRVSCGHDFHLGCIKSWLFIKNACPICKAAAFSDSPKEKQAS